MKKIKLLLKKIPLLLAFSVAAFFVACFNSSSSPLDIAPVASFFTQTALSHRAYIGGSLIYNPDNSALSQLSYGVKIAVRTSVLEKKIVSMHQVGTGSSLRTEAGLAATSP